MLYSIPTQEIQLYSFVELVQIRFQGVVCCLRIQRNQQTLRLGTGVSSWRGSGLTGVLDGETRTGVDPAYCHKTFGRLM